MALFGRRRKQRDLDRLTVGLGVAATATAGTVVGGELLRLARRRLRAAEADPAVESPTGVLETAEMALLSTGQATQDTVSVAIEGFRATPRHETVLFNLLTGFVGSLAFVRLSTHGMRAGWWPFGNVNLGGRHIHHFIPGILIAFGSGARGAVHREREARGDARGAVRGRPRPDARRGCAPARPPRRLLDPGGRPERPALARRRGPDGRHDARPADPPPRRARGRGAGRAPRSRPSRPRATR